MAAARTTGLTVCQLCRGSSYVILGLDDDASLADETSPGDTIETASSIIKTAIGRFGWSIGALQNWLLRNFVRCHVGVTVRLEQLRARSQ